MSLEPCAQKYEYIGGILIQNNYKLWIILAWLSSKKLTKTNRLHTYQITIVFKMRIILSIASQSVFISHLKSIIFELIIKYNQENISEKYFYFFLLGNCQYWMTALNLSLSQQMTNADRYNHNDKLTFSVIQAWIYI